MITQMFSVYDAAVKAYLPPFGCRSKGEAIRSFGEAANKEDHQFKKHASDYTLFYLGDFDDGSGVFVVQPHLPERVIGAMEVQEDIVPPQFAHKQ
jgi:hypothetical protein